MDLSRIVFNLIGLLLLAAFSLNAQASTPPLIKRVAIENNVPPDLFHAIVLAETRSRTQQGAKPWPWTINWKGKPYFFQTKHEAYQFAKSLTQKGITNFDIGIAQINWKWHSHRFPDLLSAFDPYWNLTAGAQHLREQYERPECNKWYIAAGCYHRPARGEKDIQIANKYRDRVLRIWEKLAF